MAKPAAEASSMNGPGEIVGVQYDLSELKINLDFVGMPTRITVAFANPVGFRVLDEGDLLEFWKDYHAGNGWLYEVESGGWHELESTREGYMSKETRNVQEYLVVGENDCVSVLVNDNERPRVYSGSSALHAS